MKNIYYAFLFVLSISASAQIKDTLPNFDDEYYLLRDGDTLMIQLNEVALLPKHKFKEITDLHYYLWFRKKVFKAYPYAVMAAKRLDSLHSRLSRIKSRRKQRKYVKTVQRFLEKELTGQLKKMTRTEGRVLVKLVHRQTAKTVFDNIKELRSGWKAFWYNTKANLFNLSLKLEYHPELENEDYLIEDILQRAFLEEKLEAQKPKINFDVNDALQKRKGEIDVERYKRMFSRMKKKKKS